PCNRWAYRLAIVMGLGFAQSQIVILLVAPLLLCLLLARPRLCREFVLANLFLWVAPVMLWMAAPGGVAPFVAVAFSCMLGVALPWRLSSDGRTALGMCLILVAGASLYAYLPLSAVGTPPMQFGDSRTWPTFMHVITRGQYERLRLAPVGSLTFLMQLRWYAELLGNQFGWLLTLVAVVPLVRCSRFHGPLAKWWATCLLVFIMFSVVLLIGVNPKMDVQDSFFQQVRFIPGFAAWAVNIGFGVLLLLPGPRNPGGPVDRATSS
ncbi:MAG: hypothetical protein O3A51_06910, partial [Verrucomicrobia bacterium]|nr:hypothetical protein [Verrucomicrobiota bacterium]